MTRESKNKTETNLQSKAEVFPIPAMCLSTSSSRALPLQGVGRASKLSSTSNPYVLTLQSFSLYSSQLLYMRPEAHDSACKHKEHMTMMAITKTPLLHNSTLEKEEEPNSHQHHLYGFFTTRATTSCIKLATSPKLFSASYSDMVRGAQIHLCP